MPAAGIISSLLGCGGRMLFSAAGECLTMHVSLNSRDNFICAGVRSEIEASKGRSMRPPMTLIASSPERLSQLASEILPFSSTISMVWPSQTMEQTPENWSEPSLLRRPPSLSPFSIDRNVPRGSCIIQIEFAPPDNPIGKRIIGIGKIEQ